MERATNNSTAAMANFSFYSHAVPFFVSAIILEQLIAMACGLPTLRLNDAFSSFSAGLISQLSKLVTLSVELVCYAYLYNNFRLLSLPWGSPWTWYLCFLGVDFTYYWLHRASHEVNIIWAAHQVHHSSEDYNLSTALRQSVTQNFSTFLFWLPMSVAVPPSVFLVHHQFNTLYQFWIHTEVVRSVGPLEYILNTPSHHRVHHGRNPYCIDKNYGGTLIIWDRLFGTFQAEREKEKIAYGLVHPLASWNPIWTQVSHYAHIWNTFWATPGLNNKLSVLFKGPGWTPGPGHPRLGNPDDLPEIEYPIVKYDSSPGLIKTLYFVLHGLVFMIAYQNIVVNSTVLGPVRVWAVVLFMLLTLTSLGATFDNTWYARHLELGRCILFLTISHVLMVYKVERGAFPAPTVDVVHKIYIASAVVCAMDLITPNPKEIKTD
ncbi:alkylglycerol monooxygenase isoform X2 [Nematostella vectensis]|uniref:alkylglycerol monooxygenase isoform X2 n=1 Tax=Nematostella vectensis TaxID=45351 RepID=UPI002077276A|nr:alkylglycerol monooxygenase isoform X2 [Nematostella vectensis]